MKVTVKAKSWTLDDFKGKIILHVHTTKLFKPENKERLMDRICRLIEVEIENYELLNSEPEKL